MRQNIEIKTDKGNLWVELVPGPHPYIWIGDKDGNCLDHFDILGSPLNVRRHLAESA